MTPRAMDPITESSADNDNGGVDRRARAQGVVLLAGLALLVYLASRDPEDDPDRSQELELERVLA